MEINYGDLFSEIVLLNLCLRVRWLSMTVCAAVWGCGVMTLYSRDYVKFSLTVLVTTVSSTVMSRIPIT